jgi:hypothetical protein
MGGVKPVVNLVKSVVTGKASDIPASVAPQVEAPKPQPMTSPTTAEVNQGEATRLLKTKRRGRSMTILTSPSGVSDQTTLSTKTLLGA